MISPPMPGLHDAEAARAQLDGRAAHQAEDRAGGAERGAARREQRAERAREQRGEVDRRRSAALPIAGSSIMPSR